MLIMQIVGLLVGCNACIAGAAWLANVNYRDNPRWVEYAAIAGCHTFLTVALLCMAVLVRLVT